jgi:hypothetical protein
MLCGKWSRRSLGGKATWFSALHAGEKQPYLVRALPIAGGKKTAGREVPVVDESDVRLKSSG